MAAPVMAGRENDGPVNGEAANDWAAGSRESEPLMLNSLNGNVAPPLK
jgi:hypothetical protein